VALRAFGYCWMPAFSQHGASSRSDSAIRRELELRRRPGRHGCPPQVPESRLWVLRPHLGQLAERRSLLGASRRSVRAVRTKRSANAFAFGAWTPS
jgi:hypothetical protein